ncbi:Transmembrane exosortase (Exosortase_EpsH) [Roseimaritima multifibrata]|uniref:Transmembrane exosortase (Exosortase_EpsH) n=1 Tax=Roseimaritima multifibrata TaxID=1930274 RepID=A0A517MMJ8_9BACT|nr:exosortase [Roseimaritima multifibrata]QDS96109.1 Transmembrane exosortase (Exosortase_EpsH) [Roseimaritima multifibrata]
MPSASTTSTTDFDNPNSSGWRTKALWIVALGVFAYATSVIAASSDWIAQPDQQHGFLVAPIAAFLLFLRRKSFPGFGRMDLRGLILLAVAAGMRIYGDLYVRPWLDLWSLPLWVAGAVWLLGGMKLFRWAAPPIAFLFFLAPLPGQVQTAAGYPLQVIAATGGGWLLQMLGQPAVVAGTTILLGDEVLDVERACAGLRMFHGMLAVAMAWSLYMGYGLRRFAASMVLAPLVAVLVNVLRIAITGLLFRYVSGDVARGFTHDWAGLLMIPAGATIFFLIDSTFDRMKSWVADRSERWLMVGTWATAAVLLFLVGGYYTHQYQQDKAIGLLLVEARSLSDGEDEADLRTAVDLMQRYLSINPTDAATISEFAFLHRKLGEDQSMRAARLHELAWREDPTREQDVLESLALLSDLGAWQLLLERTTEFKPVLEGKPRTLCMRLQTYAASQLLQYSAGGADAGQLFAACQENWKEDPSHLPHLWQIAALLKLDPSLASKEQAMALGSQGRQDKQTAVYPLGASTLTEEQPWRKLLGAGEGKAFEVIDNAIPNHPQSPELQFYRIILLQDLQLENATTEALDAAEASLDRAVTRALALAAEHSKDSVIADAPFFADETDYSPLVKSIDSQMAGALRRERVQAGIYLLAGQRAAANNAPDQARVYFEKSLELVPSNFNAYVLLGSLLPQDANEERIALFTKGLEACGTQELALILPLATAYISSGKEGEAETLLRPLEAMLPKIAAAQRGQIELMLASAHAAGLSQRQEYREAAKMLSEACSQQSILSQRRNFAALYARAQFQLGSLYRTLNQDAAAAAAFQEGGRFDPESPIWHLNAAQAYELAGNSAAALAQYQQAAAVIGRQEPGVYLAIARVLMQDKRVAPSQGDLAEVRSMIRVAAQRGAALDIAAALQAETYVIEERYDDALQVLRKQIEQTPDLPGLHYSSALVHQLAGDFAAAQVETRLYEAAGATAGEVLALRVNLLDRFEQFPEAMRIVDENQDGLSDEDLRAARTQILLGCFRRGMVDEGLERGILLAQNYRDDLAVQKLAAQLFEDLRLDEELIKVEKNLRSIEGEEGTYWRATLAARLLRNAESEQQVAEATQLIQQLEQLLPDWPQTLMLRGRLAARLGRWQQALTAFESAWNVGLRDAALASQFLNALNQTGQSARAVEIIDEIDQLVPQSTSLFDSTMPQFVQRDRSEYVLDLARRWAEDDPTPENLTRLGQTLSLVAISRRANLKDGEDAEPVDLLLSEAEAVLERSIAEAPGELGSWIAIFRLEAEGRGQRDRALERLATLSKQLEIPALQRNFVLAQLYARTGEDARAGQVFEDCLDLVQDQTPQIQATVRLAAAEFFAPRRPELAQKLCLELVQMDSEYQVAATNLLLNLLLTKDSPGAIDEAIALHAAEMGRAETIDDASKRLQARLLFRRATTEPENGNRAANRNDGIQRNLISTRPVSLEGSADQTDSESAAVSSVEPITGQALEDLAEAASLLESISPRRPEDATLLAQVYAAQGRDLYAFNTYREALRLEIPTADRLVKFLEFWISTYAASGQYRPIADRYLSELAGHRAEAARWLRLRLQWNQQFANTDAGDRDGEATAAAPLQPMQSDEEILQEYRQVFLANTDQATRNELVVQCIFGLALAKRQDAIALALEGFKQSGVDAKFLAVAAAAATLRSIEERSTSQALCDWLIANASAEGPTFDGITQLIGDALFLGGRGKNAEEYYRATLAKSPENSGVMNSLALLLAEQPTGFDEAIALIDQAIELQPDSEDLVDSKLIIALLGDDLELAAELESQLQSDFTAGVLMHRAVLADKLKQPEEASRLFQMARDARVGSGLQTASDKEMYATMVEKYVKSND